MSDCPSKISSKWLEKGNMKGNSFLPVLDGLIKKYNKKYRPQKMWGVGQMSFICSDNHSDCVGQCRNENNTSYNLMVMTYMSIW